LLQGGVVLGDFNVFDGPSYVDGVVVSSGGNEFAREVRLVLRLG